MVFTSGSAHETKMKELDDRIQAINQVLMAAISNEDRVSLNFMLCELKYEKSELQNKQFCGIMAKYGHRCGFSSSVPPSRPQRPDTVITIDSPSPKDKSTDRKLNGPLNRPLVGPSSLLKDFPNLHRRPSRRPPRKGSDLL